MRRLTLLRHAKTEAGSSTGRDFDRELTDRGRRNAERLGEEIRRLGLTYDLVLSSPSMRTVQTVECVGGLEARYEDRIYDASTGDLFEVVRAAPSEISSLMLVGHNPGFERLAQLAAPGSVTDFPTCALAEIELAVDDWRQVESHCGRLVRFINPKELD